MNISQADLLNILIIIYSIILVVAVMYQARGTGLGGIYGGTSGGGESFRSRRGMEKLFYYTTIFSGIVLVALCLSLSFVLKNV